MAKAPFKACPACRNPAKCAKGGMCAMPKMSKGGTLKKTK